jgi:hypothetical protein
MERGQESVDNRGDEGRAQLSTGDACSQADQIIPERRRETEPGVCSTAASIVIIQRLFERTGDPDRWTGENRASSLDGSNSWGRGLARVRTARSHQRKDIKNQRAISPLITIEKAETGTIWTNRGNNSLADER